MKKEIIEKLEKENKKDSKRIKIKGGKMNDRLKFRFWDEDFGYKYFKLGEEAPTDDCLSNEWEQCTGLKDKNGKLIYEGDIVKTWDIEGDNEFEGVCEWSDLHVRLILRENSFSNANFNKFCKFEIIGNIHSGGVNEAK